MGISAGKFVSLLVRAFWGTRLRKSIFRPARVNQQPAIRIARGLGLDHTVVDPS